MNEHKLVLRPSGFFLFLNSIFRYLAAKAHYFGTGGNVNQFEEYLQKDGLLEVDSCFSYEEGIPIFSYLVKYDCIYAALMFGTLHKVDNLNNTAI